MSDLIRVSDKETGHQYSVPAHLFDESAHRLLDKPGADVRGVAIPAKYNADLPKAGSANTAATKAEKESAQ